MNEDLNCSKRINKLMNESMYVRLDECKCFRCVIAGTCTCESKRMMKSFNIQVLSCSVVCTTVSFCLFTLSNPRKSKQIP